MATLNKKGGDAARYAGVPSGNAWVGVYSFETNSSGKWIDDNAASPAAVGVGDVVRLGVIPAGTKLLDAMAIISDAFTATETFDIGFQYVDGVDSTDVPQDADYFFATLAISLGRTSATNTGVRPVTLPKDAYLILTNNTAAANAVGKLDVVVFGEVVGAK